MRNVLLTLSITVLLAGHARAQASSIPASPAPATQPAPAPAPQTQAPAAPAPGTQSPGAPATTAPPVPAALPMAGPTGMVFHVIKADKTADFEAVMTRLRDLLAVSNDAVRRSQAAGWRVFRQVAPMGDGNVLYVSMMDPVVANAEYDVPRLLAEAAPAEAALLYEQFRDAHVQPNVQAANLSLVVSLAPATPAAPPAQP